MKKIFLFLLLFFITFINVSADEVVSVKIDGEVFDQFDINTLNYQINVDGSKDKTQIDVVYDSEVYEVSPDFKVLSLKYGDNPFCFTITKKDDAEFNKKYTITLKRTDNRKGDNSLTSLTVGTNKIVLGDSNEYSVSVDGKTNSIEIQATLPEGASFVEGYGERTGNNAVKLTNPTTSVEIKVKAENESIRTYKININKTNLQSNDATLKSLKVEGVDFEFKSSQLEYNLSVKSSISSVKIEAVKNHEKANIDYKNNVTLNTGSNNIEIKVIAEDGTTKVYKLNITREEEVPIVKDIKITGIDFEFDPKTYSYKIETTLSKLDFNVTLSSETATSEITNNEDLKNNSIVKIIAKDGDETVTYSFRIINIDKSVDIKTNTDTVVTTGTTNNNSLKQYEMIIGLGVFGLGIMSALIAVLLKRKSKVV